MRRLVRERTVGDLYFISSGCRQLALLCIFARDVIIRRRLVDASLVLLAHFFIYTAYIGLAALIVELDG